MKYWKYVALAALIAASPVNAKIIEWRFESDWYADADYDNPPIIAQGTLIFDTSRSVITTLRFVSNEFVYENTDVAPYIYMQDPLGIEIKGNLYIGHFELTNGMRIEVPQFHLMEEPSGGTIEETLPSPWTIFVVHDPVSERTVWITESSWSWKRVNPTEVPEPTTIALLGLGLAGLTLRRRLS